MEEKTPESSYLLQIRAKELDTQSMTSVFVVIKAVLLEIGR